MIEVADDQRLDRAELRQQQSKHSQLLHDAQRARGVRTDQDLAQRGPALRPRRSMRGHRGQRLLDAQFRAGGELEAVLRDKLKAVEEFSGETSAEGCCRKMRPLTQENSSVERR